MALMVEKIRRCVILFYFILDELNQVINAVGASMLGSRLFYCECIQRGVYDPKRRRQYFGSQWIPYELGNKSSGRRMR